MRLLVFFSILILICHYPLKAQTVHIGGVIEDSSTHEKLSGATIRVQMIKKSDPTGVSTTNRYGYFGLALVPNSYTISASYVGYHSRIIKLELKKDTIINFQLSSIVNQLQPVIVRTQYNMPDLSIGHYQIPLTYIKQAPALLGETDALKVIQTLPGVQGGMEGTAGLHVRGGSPDQNLLLLDGMPVYNAFHLFGFFSVFNTDALRSVDFHKGHIPARYGGRLSSVIDINTKEGNATEAHYKFGISPIAGNLLVEGPIKKGVISYMVSARRTWLDAITYVLSKNIDGSKTGYNFDDANAKINYRMSASSHLYLSVYRGRDRFNSAFQDGSYKTKFQFNWGNYTSTLRYTHLYGSKLFASFQIGYVDYRYQIVNEYQNPNTTYISRIASKIQDLTARSDFDWKLSDSHHLRFGTISTQHQFLPYIRQSRGFIAEASDTTLSSIKTIELGLYAEDEWRLTNRMVAQLGLHQAANKAQQYWYVNPQPRLSVSYTIKEGQKAMISYDQLTQYIHLLTNAGLGLPTDLWIPSSAALPPQRVQHYSIGYINQASDPSFRFSLEGYYKTMRNVLEYRDGMAFLTDQVQSLPDRVFRGQGRSYGLEAFLQKSSGRLTGWLSYTLARHERQFDQLNDGSWFPYRYDRRHNLNLLLTYRVSPKHQLTGSFIYTSGNVATLATSVYQGINLPTITQDPIRLDFFNYYQRLEDLSVRNNFRLPAYHRFDVSYQFNKIKRHGSRQWVMSCYNIYNRRNPFFVFYQEGKLYQFTLFPIIPSLSYHREF